MRQPKEEVIIREAGPKPLVPHTGPQDVPDVCATASLFALAIGALAAMRSVKRKQTSTMRAHYYALDDINYAPEEREECQDQE